MSLVEETALLRAIPMLANLEESRLKLIAFTSDRVCFAADELLFQAGTSGDCAYLIISGGVEILVSDEAGNMFVAANLGKNDLLGEIALLCDIPRTATARAVADTEALVISKETFFHLLREFPDIAIEIMRILAQRLGNMNQRLVEVGSASAR